MTREQFQSILKSFLLTVSVAYVLAFTIMALTHHYTFFPWELFIIFFLIQVVGYPLFDSLSERVTIARAITQAAKAQTEIIEEAVSKQSLNLNCAYCNQPNNNVPVILTQENLFKCMHCGQENAIYMQFYAARKTNPVMRKTEAKELEQGIPEATPIL